MKIQSIRRENFRRMTWANGKGATEEIIREDDARGMLWRISIAEVREAGPFSRLPGVDRHLLLLEGSGFAVRIGGGPALPVSAKTPLVFSGDDEAAATDVLGPCRDFNVMARRGTIHAQTGVAVAGARESIASCQTLCIFATAAATVVVDAAAHRLVRHELLIVTGASGFTVPAGTIICRITPLPGQ